MEEWSKQDQEFEQFYSHKFSKFQKLNSMIISERSPVKRDSTTTKSNFSKAL